MDTSTAKQIALLPIAASVLAWTPVFIRLAEKNGASPLIIVTNRMFIASALLLIFVWLFKRASLARLSRRGYLCSVVAGIIFGFHLYAFVVAVKYTTVANSVILLATVPIFAAFFGHFILKETPRPASYFAILLTMVGSVMIVWGDIRWDPSHLKGDLFAIGAAALNALYLLVRRYLPKSDKPVFFPYILGVYLTATIVLGLLTVLTGRTAQLGGHSAEIWLWFFLLAVGSTLIGHSLMNKALDFFKTHVVGSWVLTEPIISAVLAWIILSEALDPRVLWGVVPIYIGVSWILWIERKG